MLGVFLVICLAAYWFIKLKIYILLKADYNEPVQLDANKRTYEVCYRAMILHAVSNMVILLGYVGCAWPYLFIEGLGIGVYIVVIAMSSFIPVAIIVACYSDLKNARGYVKISTGEIEYQSNKHFIINISDIKKISYPGMGTYQIHLKEKGKKCLYINFNAFYKEKEIRSLMEQLREHIAVLNGRDKSFAHRFSPWRLEMFLGKYFFLLYNIALTLILLYTSYCCIDYDFYKKDYTAQFNAMGSVPGQSENAWPHYVQTAVNYRKLDEDIQAIIKDGMKSDQLELTDDQKDIFKAWFNENTSSWTSLKKAASINYCNAAYNNISFLDNTDRDDFSNPSDTGYGQIKHLYSNTNASRLAGVIDLDWLDLFQMQLASSNHFVNGKTFMDQLVGYAMLGRSIKLLSKQDSYELEDLQKTREMLKEYYPASLPPLNIEGEILIICNFLGDMTGHKYLTNDVINLNNVPIQTPLNPAFLMCGSGTGTEAYVRKHYTAALEQARKGIEVESKDFSIISFPIMRNSLIVSTGTVDNVYKASQRTNTNLLAAYVLLDLKEYQLMKGRYPIDVQQLKEAGLTSPLPNDTDSDGKIIYSNDGKRAILYAVGKNGKDDGGYRDEKGCDEKRDDIIYWQKDVN